LWGYVEGSTWSSGTGILNSNGTERQAMAWLKEYIEGLPNVGYPFNDGATTGIYQKENIQSVSIYPNPVTSGKVVIASKSDEIISSIELIDLQGKIVKTVKPTQTKTEIEVSSLIKGIYFLRIQTEKSVLSDKIVIL